MESARMFLAVVLMIALNLNLTAGDSSATWDDFQKSSDVRAKKEFSLEDQKPTLFRRLTSAALDEPAGNNTSNSTSGGGWLVQCNNLGEDLEKSWNLTVVVAEANWPVVENVAETLYTMILDCTKSGIGGVIKDAKCLIDNLVVLKNILVPAVQMNLKYVEQAWHLVPEFVTSTKQCFSFGSYLSYMRNT